MKARLICALLATLGAIIDPTEGLKMSSIQRKVYTNRLAQQQQRQPHDAMRGRLGHLRPRLWYGATAVEEASPTSLKAALKFKNFEDMLKNFRDNLIVVTFSAELCGPCRLMKKELNQVSEVIGEEVKIVAIDTERFPKLGARYDISVLPTVVIFKGGEVHDRMEGLNTAESILEWLRPLM